MTSIEVSGPPVDRSVEVLTPEALEFVADLQRQFGARRAELLAARRTRRERIAAGERPAFLDSTAEIRSADWQVAVYQQALDAGATRLIALRKVVDWVARETRAGAR